MAKVLVSDQYLTNIANAIREKNETNITYTPAQMASAILAINPKIGVVTTTPSSRSSSITFTGLQAEPLAFVCYMSAQGTISKSYRTCCPVIYDGSTIRNTTFAVSGSSIITYTYTNYSNGSLTITSPSTGANGYFQAMQHYLMYVYE